MSAEPVHRLPSTPSGYHPNPYVRGTALGRLPTSAERDALLEVLDRMFSDGPAVSSSASPEVSEALAAASRPATAEALGLLEDLQFAAGWAATRAQAPELSPEASPSRARLPEVEALRAAYGTIVPLLLEARERLEEALATASEPPTSHPRPELTEEDLEAHPLVREARDLPRWRADPGGLFRATGLFRLPVPWRELVRHISSAWVETLWEALSSPRNDLPCFEDQLPSQWLGAVIDDLRVAQDWLTVFATEWAPPEDLPTEARLWLGSGSFAVRLARLVDDLETFVLANRTEPPAPRAEKLSPEDLNRLKHLHAHVAPATTYLETLLHAGSENP